jgi:hypothetical protein
MNVKKLVLTMLVIFVLSFLTGFLIHAILLRQDYMAVANLYRPEGQEKMLWIVLAYLAFAIGSVWIYARGVEDKPWLGQGVRFGIALWLVLTVPSFFIAYAVQPITEILMTKQVIFELVDKVFLGIVTALVYGKGN